MTRSIIAFDLEGPLSPQDNAYELMGTMDGGYEIFERISRYDDILTLEKREGYEPGDTLYLILPFLILEGKGRKDVLEISERAYLTPGAMEVMEYIKEKGWRRVIISTSYEPHAYYIGGRLGVNRRDIACTYYPLNGRIDLTEDERKIISEFRDRLRDIPPEDEMRLKSLLDDFYFNILPSMKIHRIISEVKVVGGSRKVDALKRFCDDYEPEKVVCIGDSITDMKMLEYVRKRGGLSIAFNGNEYAVPHALVGVASLNLISVIPLIERYITEGMDALMEFIKEEKDDPYKTYYDYIPLCEDLEEVITRHKLMRRELRGRAANLG